MISVDIVYPKTEILLKESSYSNGVYQVRKSSFHEGKVRKIYNESVIITLISHFFNSLH